jgi:hypothetical protein
MEMKAIRVREIEDIPRAKEFQLLDTFFPIIAASSHFLSTAR